MVDLGTMSTRMTSSSAHYANENRVSNPDERGGMQARSIVALKVVKHNRPTHLKQIWMELFLTS